MAEQPKCELCGDPMPVGEEMFKFHGYSGPCPKPHMTPVNKLTDDSILELWRSVQGPHAELTGPLIRFAHKIAAIAKSEGN
jgi:hypothetical protein